MSHNNLWPGYVDPWLWPLVFLLFSEKFSPRLTTLNLKNHELENSRNSPYSWIIKIKLFNLILGETIGMVLMGTLTNIFILSLLSFFAFLAVKLGKFSPEFKHAYANAHVKVESWICCSVMRVGWLNLNLKSWYFSDNFISINFDVWFVDNSRSTWDNDCWCLSW